MTRSTLLTVTTVGLAVVTAACAPEPAAEPEPPRAVVTITDRTRGGEGNQIEIPAGVECVAGQRVTVEVEITGNVVPPPADALIGEAICGDQAVATAQVTAQPPMGHDWNFDRGQQTEGAAACRASWTFIPNPNTPVWSVKCTFS